MQRLPYIPDADVLIDKAFREGCKTAKAVKSTNKPKTEKIKQAEVQRIKKVSDIITSDLEATVKNLPRYETLTEFHKKLFTIKTKPEEYEKSLKAVEDCILKIRGFKAKYIQKIKSGYDYSIVREFLGKTSTAVKKIRNDLKYLAEVKEVLKSFPEVEEAFTVVVSGYPNVGKSTFMKNLTGCKVKVAAYPFTTKEISIGYYRLRHERIQVIDCPGLLDRCMEDRNPIELQAVAALTELADVVLFIIDASMDLRPQLSLLQELKGWGLRIYVAVNKVDVTPKTCVDNALNQVSSFPCFTLTALDKDSCIHVFEEILRMEEHV